MGSNSFNVQRTLLCTKYISNEMRKQPPKAEQAEVSKKGTSLRTRTAQKGRKGPAFNGWALSGATRRAEQKWMLFERSEFHPFPDRSKAK